MAKNLKKLTAFGNKVDGALSLYLKPRLAADAALKPGEIPKALLEMDPAKKYSEQIPLITKLLGDAFTKRLAKDADLADLPEVLEALKEFASGEPDGDKEEMDKLPLAVAKDDDEDPGEKLCAMLSDPKYGIPPEDLAQMTTLINTLGGKVAPVGDKEVTAGTLPPKKGENPFPAKKPGAGAPEPPGKIPAMDSAAVAKIVEKNVADKFRAAEECLPFLGKIDALAFDSAPAIYAEALKRIGGVDTKDVQPSALRTLLLMQPNPESRPARVALDAAALTDFHTKYPHAPTVG